MTGLPWYAHYLEHYDRDTSHLTMLQHGAYRLLLDQYYKYGKPLPTDVEQLHHVCRAFAEQERTAIAFVLSEFFVLKKDGYHQLRADLELKKAKAISSKRSKAAKSRHKKVHAKAPANAPPSGPANGGASDEHLDTHLTQTHNPVRSKNKEVLEIVHSVGNGAGKKNGASVTIEDAHERIARFQAKVAKALGPKGWEIVASAADKNDPQHDVNIGLCRQAAKSMGKGWPRAWT